MRIVEFISGLGRGGAERALASRLKHAPSNVETSVICTSHETSTLEQEIRRHARVYFEPRFPLRTLRTLEPDIIITHNPREAIRVLGHPTVPQLIPTVVVAHNEISSESGLKSAILNPVLAFVNSRAAAHIAVSSRAARGIQCRNARSVSTHILGSEISPHVGPNADIWPAYAEIRLLVLGRFSRQKNLGGFLNAVALIRSTLVASRVHICLVGEGRLEESLRLQIATMGLENLVTLVGWIEPPDAVIAGADVLFIPSLHEGGPLTLYEALMAGRVVIATPVGAVPDVKKLLIEHSGDSHSLHVLADTSIRSISQALAELPDIVGRSLTVRSAEPSSYLETATTSSQFYDLCFQAQAQFDSRQNL